MLVLPQITPPLIMPNDAVALWDGVDTLNVTTLTAATAVPSSPPAPINITDGTLAIWLRIPATLSSGSIFSLIDTYQTTSDSRGFRIYFQKSGSNWSMFLTVVDVGGSPIFSHSFSISGNIDSTLWQHFQITWGAIGSTSGYVNAYYWDGSVERSFASGSVGVSGTIFERGYLNINRGLGGGIGSPIPIELYDYYVVGSALDLTDITNVRRKFIDASNKPVNLGSRGQHPTGTQPLLFFSGIFNSWRENKGSVVLSSDLTASTLTYFTKASTKPT